MNCPACGHALEAGARFCPACRERGQKAPIVRPVAPPGAAAPGAPVARATSGEDPRERTFLIIACLFSAGALAIPRLVRSRAFGPVGKIVLGTIAALQTLLVVGIVVALVVKGPALFALWMDWLARHGHARGF